MPDSAVRQPARVLVVDDDLFMRDLLTRMFVNAGVLVEAYASASELLSAADLRSPGVLLLDMKMPILTGLELQRLLREEGVTLPVIFLTGASSVPLAVAAMRNGAVDFIEKPFDAAALVARVNQTYARHVRPGLPDEQFLAPETQLRLAILTSRERDVLGLMVTGQTSKEIARELGGSFRTIEIHRGRIMKKMAAASLADLVRMTLDGNPAPA